MPLSETVKTLSASRWVNRVETSFASLFKIDLRALAFFRISLALVFFIDLLLRARDIGAFYTDDGLVPRAFLWNYFQNENYLSFHGLSGGLWFQAVLFGLHGLFAISMLIGYRTRTSVFLCWVLLVSLQSRNPLVLQNGDVYLLLLFFWSLFLPLGARWSFDSLRSGSVNELPKGVASLGTVAIFFQVFTVYFFSALHKTDPEWTVQGTAVYLALSLRSYTTTFGRFLLGFPDLLRWTTFTTVFLEKWAVWFLFFPIRTGFFRITVVGLLVLMHLGFLVCLSIGFFPWVCLCPLVLFLPEFVWDRIEKKLGWFAQRFESIPKAPTRSASVHLSFGGDLMAGFFLAYVLFYNLGGVIPAAQVPDRIKNIFRPLRLEQCWTMFAPGVFREDGWYVIPARLKDGSWIDLWNGDKPLSWEEPAPDIWFTRDDHWRRFMFHFLSWPDLEWPYLAEYLKKEWNRQAPDARKIEEVECYYMQKSTVLPGETSVLKKISLGDNHYDMALIPRVERPLPQP